MTASYRVAAAFLPLALIALPASATERPAAEAAATVALEGEPAGIGRGMITPFAELAEDGAPHAIGIRIDAAAMEELPAERNATSRCFDLNGDGELQAQEECEGDHELRLVLPSEVSESGKVPFKWVMVNWQPHGHDPMPWSVPHFDIHFYTIPQQDLDAIALGPCDFFIDCEAQERALKPVPAELVHEDHISVGAVVGQMGDHLIDSKTPELGDAGVPFTHTWIFGAYDGGIIFHEVMVTRDYLQTRESGCHPIKQPKAWQAAGWYPTSYCVGYDEERNAHVVAMQDFVERPASGGLTMIETKDQN